MRKSIADIIILILSAIVFLLALLCSIPAQGQWEVVTDQGIRIEIVSEYPYLSRPDVEQSVRAMRTAGVSACAHIQYEILETQDDLIWFRCKIWQVSGVFEVPHLCIRVGQNYYAPTSWLSVSGPAECGLVQIMCWREIDLSNLWRGDGYTKSWIAFKRIKPNIIQDLIVVEE